MSSPKFPCLRFLHLFLVPLLSSAAGSPPNVLFIAVDDLRLQSPVYGQEHMVTPGLERLAAQSVVFSRAYVSVPVCGASRASLLSGARPADNRFWDYKARKDVDFPEAPSLPKWFKDHGYTTISNGKITIPPKLLKELDLKEGETITLEYKKKDTTQATLSLLSLFSFKQVQGYFSLSEQYQFHI